MPTRLSIVIPVGPGDEAWRALLSQLARLAVCEIIVVFPSEPLYKDTTRLELIDSRIHVMFAPCGRARQLNAGAAATRSDWVWFLHADSFLKDQCVEALRRHMTRDRLALGYFDLRFLDDGPLPMALNSLGAWLRSRCFHLPFGDQGFVLSRPLFDSLEGFDETLRYGEDHDLIWRARALGARIVPVGAALYTSARKYALGGWWQTTAGHLVGTWQQAREFSRRARI